MIRIELELVPLLSVNLGSSKLVYIFWSQETAIALQMFFTLNSAGYILNEKLSFP